VQYKSIFAMIFNQIKCHVNTSSGLVGGCIPYILPLCPRLSALGKHRTKFLLNQMRQTGIKLWRVVRKIS